MTGILHSLLNSTGFLSQLIRSAAQLVGAYFPESPHTSGNTDTPASLKQAPVELGEESIEKESEAPWWAKKKKKEDEDEDEKDESTTFKPTYSTFGWVDETVADTTMSPVLTSTTTTVSSATSSISSSTSTSTSVKTSSAPVVSQTSMSGVPGDTSKHCNDFFSTAQSHTILNLL